MRVLGRYLARLRARRGQQDLRMDPMRPVDVSASIEEVLEAGVEDEVSRRWTAEVEALLVARLEQMRPLGSARAVDDGLISCAEYQLYLDEVWLTGHVRSPDHWPGGQFPPGEGRMPALGVRYGDAVAFCRWLTDRDRDGRRYRLPYAGELDAHEMPRRVQLALPPGGGYWVTAPGGAGQFVRASKGESTLGCADLAAWIERDLAAGRDLLVESALALGRDLSGALGLDPDLDRAEARELADELAKALDPVLDRARDVDRQMADALGLAVDRAQRIGYALDGGGVRGLEQVVIQAQDIDRALAIAHYRAHALPRARRLARVTSRAVDRAHGLNGALARAAISDVMRILLLTGNRVSAVDRAQSLAQAVARDVDHGAPGDLGRGVVRDLDHAHVLNRVRNPDLSLALARACEVSRPYDLERAYAALGGGELDAPQVEETLRHALSRVRAVLNDPDLDHVGAHTLDRAEARDLEHTLAHDLALVRALSRCAGLVRDQVGALNPEIARDLDLSRALGMLAERIVTRWPEAVQGELSPLVRQFVRFEALARVVSLDALTDAPPEPWAGGTGRVRARTGRLEAEREAALDVYIQLGILEDRVEGQLPAWEGIRIVREGEEDSNEPFCSQ